MLPATKHTHLEKTDDVLSTLKWKLEKASWENLPVEKVLADYFALALDNLAGEKAYLKSAKKEIDLRMRAISEQEDAIKIGGAEFLLGMDVEKLEGAICSSVTVTAAKEEEREDVEMEVFELIAPEAEVQSTLIALGLAKFTKKIEEKHKDASPAKIKVNKRKIPIAEPVDEHQLKL